ncbi:hypothetical protein DWB85_05925 [Seongchinamella sediminis]|uniref:Sugar lactone lactonase YvrE n=1 Tax=Seongchinamella sediminis TaxID=2283635 RepID=A0A3L7DZ72_9GAMM|nr:PQQ-binding-like beta-propeller repeat protein [Seongchinamella sediminis]RLQ22526.1 hypothetical protein DWB85_05925 [Seongchinamella sediminis]
MKNHLILTAFITLASSLPALAESGKQAAFPKHVPVLTGSPVEGFTIGSGTTAYSSSIDGSIYKVDLRSGEGEVLVAPEDSFDIFSDCYKLGMRVDPRSNYLYAAGCFWGNAYVFDADSGEEIARLTVTNFGQVINDIAITRDAVYFTNFSAPFIHRLPLAANGQMIEGEAPLPIAMQGDDNGDPLASPLTANGIVATPNGDALIIGDSVTAQIYRVDPLTGHANRIVVEPPLQGFIDGIVMHEDTLYILSPGNPADPTDIDRIQVVELDRELLNGTLVGNIVDPDLDGVASGAMLGGSLYVNNARYRDFPLPTTEYSVTRLNRKDVSPLQ